MYAVYVINIFIFLWKRRNRLMTLLKVKNLKIHFPVRGGVLRRVIDHVQAVDGVSFHIKRGETYGLVGESGSGKTTTGRGIIGLNRITSGKIIFDGHDITNIRRSRFERLRDIQMIFQDPHSSLNPKKRIIDIVAEPLRNAYKMTKDEERQRVIELLERVGLGASSIYKYPHEFSGGQLQRIGIARAIALKPKLIIADEPVSALDVSIQAQVLNFMKEIQKELNLTYLIISHDLGVIRHMCEHIGVMYKGRYVEEGLADEVFKNPQHIYTKRLVSAIPNIDPRQRELHMKMRQKVVNHYNYSHDFYFNKDGTARELINVTDTHKAAIPEKGRGKHVEVSN